MKQSLQLRLGQQLTMTPQLQQAIRLLQLSTLDLQAEIQEALESNPLLEVNEVNESGEAASEQWEGGDASAATNEPNNSSEYDSVTTETASLERQDAAVDLQTTEMPDELPVDSNWEDVYDSVLPASSASSSSSDDDYNGFENQSDGGESLQEHLQWQMRLTPFSDLDMQIAEAIIDSINEEGYLTSSLEDIHSSLTLDEGVEVELDEIEAVLHRIQNFDPIGVGARDLRECMLLQLLQLDRSIPEVEDAITLVRDHLDLLASRDYNQLMRKMKLTREALQQAILMIQSVNPRPGSTIDSTPAEYIVPDVFVKKVNETWRVELNLDAVPKLRVNAHYASLIRRADNSADNTYLRNQLQEARWFIKSLSSRNETLLKVATAIVARQRGFLEFGEEAMKALVLHDIAEELGMHESTISRVTTKKYMHTPRGIFELKYFFSSHVSTAEGGECSSTAIRALIKKLVAAENQGKPLSDSKIAQILEDEGINVARRTVAKYREALSIPPSNERKRLV
jgi:RNA polymerase sigma-54 factor